MVTSENTAEYSISVLGISGSGKSSLILRFMVDKYVEDYHPRIEDSWYLKTEISMSQDNPDNDKVVCIVKILEIHNEDEYASMGDAWIRECDGFVIVYDITSRESFEQTVILYQTKILSVVVDENDLENNDNQTPPPPIIIVGTKCDAENERQVTVKEGITYAQECNALFCEVSAKHRINHKECFHKLIREINLRQIKPNQMGDLPKEKTCNKCCLLL